jgi:hypothetical protein
MPTALTFLLASMLSVGVILQKSCIYVFRYDAEREVSVQRTRGEATEGRMWPAQSGTLLSGLECKILRDWLRGSSAKEGRSYLRFIALSVWHSSHLRPISSKCFNSRHQQLTLNPPEPYFDGRWRTSPPRCKQIPLQYPTAQGRLKEIMRSRYPNQADRDSSHNYLALFAGTGSKSSPGWPNDLSILPAVVFCGQWANLEKRQGIVLHLYTPSNKT